MELICPECMGALQTNDGASARCTIHGGEYQILFSHWQAPPAPLPENPITPAEGTVCAQHPNVAAIAVCQCCGTPLCDTCAFPGSEGRKVCLNCVPRVPKQDPYSFTPPPVSIPAEARCLQHPASAATQLCKICGSYMCATCDFLMPGNYHLCPKCATAPQPALSSRRKKLMFGSFALAIMATLGMVLMMSGALAGMVHNRSDLGLIGLVFTMIVLAPSLVGMGLGFSAIDKRLSNPLSLWVATIWNLAIAAIFLLLCIVGTLK